MLRHWIYLILFNPQNNPVIQFVLSLFYRWETEVQKKETLKSREEKFTEFPQKSEGRNKI